MRDGTITPIEFLQKIASIDNKIMRANSEELLIGANFEDSIESNSESDSESDDNPSNCVICNKNRIEVLLMPCSHVCCCKKCWDKQQDKVDNVDSKGRPLCPLRNCKTDVKKSTFVEI